MSSASSAAENPNGTPTPAEARFRAAFDLLATLSHAIRTPMNGILGMSRLLVRGRLQAEERRHAEIIHSSAESLLRLIDEILDIAKIEAGQLLLEPADFRLREVVGETVELLSAQARSKGLTLRFSVAEETPEALSGDAHRLRQVLLNLVDNGVKFTERGFVFVSVAAVESPDGGGARSSWIRFTVRDTGVGIEPDLMPKLFDSFPRSDVAAPSAGGLGLAIIKRLVDLMGGSIDVESTPGQGSTFTFRLPFEAARDSETLLAPPKTPASPPDRRRRESYRILVAEDDEINSMLALQILAEAGYRADAVYNGFKALEALEEKAYDLILMDCQMPQLDGYEATRLIRQLEKGARGSGYRHIPVIAVTARTMRHDREKCVDAGMDDFLAKPYRAEDLVKAVDRNLELEGGGHDEPALVVPVGPMEEEPQPGVLDRAVIDQLRELVQPSQEGMLSTLVDTFVRDKTRRCRELKQAFIAGDSPRLANRAHKLISASGSVGAYYLAKLCGDLEILARDARLDECRGPIEEIEAELNRVEVALRKLVTSS